MKPTVLLIVPMLLLCASCAWFGGAGDRENYPDVTVVPDRPEADLSAERRQALEEELRQVREDAVRQATEGRTTAPSSDEDAPDVVGDETGSADTGRVGDSQSE